jgi:hypothetical protein
MSYEYEMSMNYEIIMVRTEVGQEHKKFYRLMVLVS